MRGSVSFDVTTLAWGLSETLIGSIHVVWSRGVAGPFWGVVGGEPELSGRSSHGGVWGALV